MRKSDLSTAVQTMLRRVTVRTWMDAADVVFVHGPIHHLAFPERKPGAFAYARPLLPPLHVGWMRLIVRSRLAHCDEVINFG
jgi:hypothetical protein